MSIKAPWKPLGGTNQEGLVDARRQAHWGGQLLAAAADSLLPAAPDDSHTNLFWDHTREALVGRDLGGVCLGLRLSDLSILTLVGGEADQVTPLTGSTLEELCGTLANALEPRVGRTPRLALREYDMPSHPVGDGASFSAPNAPALTELAAWFANGTETVAGLAKANQGATQVAVWPHHFDVGGVILLDPDAPADHAPQIGFGMSPGDHHIPMPYFYVTAWPISDKATMTDLPAGRWIREGFTGAVLEAHEVWSAGSAETQSERVAGFLSSAVGQGEALIRAAPA